ncbi:hypothetical protein M0R72_07075 [Candidatus Pacearchaeota archaeon]|jgi:hypothetical protein|nr:hypothetical protein [Candidatus Pacearchaeota archaeon]
MQERIAVYISPNERGSDRAKHLALAIYEDNRFMLPSFREIGVDLQFSIVEHVGHDLLGEEYCDKILNIELKEPNDFVQSVLSGHLQEQVLSCREAGQDACVVILGGSDEIYAAIKDSATGRGVKRSEIGHVIASVHARCKSFRKRSMLNGVPVFHAGDDSGFFDSEDQFKDILELAHDYLTDGDMMGFRQRPAGGERELLAAAILFHGDKIGPGVLKPVMEQYELCLLPRGEFAEQPCDIKGIGPKRAAIIDKKIAMVYGMRAKA